MFPTDIQCYFHGTIFLFLHLDMMDQDIAVFHLLLQMLQSIGNIFISDGKAFVNRPIQFLQMSMGKNLYQKDQQCGKNAHKIHPCADGKTNACHRPDACCRCQPFDGNIPHKDHPCAQERNPRDHVGGDTSCIHTHPRNTPDIHKAIFGNDHQKGGPQCNDDMGTQTGFLSSAAALKTNDAAANAGNNHPQ